MPRSPVSPTPAASKPEKTAAAPRRRLVLIAMVLLATTLAVLLRPVRREDDFHIPSAAETRRAEAMFADVLDLGQQP